MARSHAAITLFTGVALVIGVALFAQVAQQASLLWIQVDKDDTTFWMSRRIHYYDQYGNILRTYVSGFAVDDEQPQAKTFKVETVFAFSRDAMKSIEGITVTYYRRTNHTLKHSESPLTNTLRAVLAHEPIGTYVGSGDSSKNASSLVSYSYKLSGVPDGYSAEVLYESKELVDEYHSSARIPYGITLTRNEEEWVEFDSRSVTPDMFLVSVMSKEHPIVQVRAKLDLTFTHSYTFQAMKRYELAGVGIIELPHNFHIEEDDHVEALDVGQISQMAVKVEVSYTDPDGVKRQVTVEHDDPKIPDFPETGASWSAPISGDDEYRGVARVGWVHPKYQSVRTLTGQSVQAPWLTVEQWSMLVGAVWICWLSSQAWVGSPTIKKMMKRIRVPKLKFWRKKQ